MTLDRSAAFGLLQVCKMNASMLGSRLYIFQWKSDVMDLRSLADMTNEICGNIDDFPSRVVSAIGYGHGNASSRLIIVSHCIIRALCRISGRRLGQVNLSCHLRKELHDRPLFEVSRSNPRTPDYDASAVGQDHTKFSRLL